MCLFPTLQELRQKEKEIQKQLDAGIDYEAGQITVIELLEKYISLKKGVRYNTQVGYRFVLNLVRKEDFGCRKISTVKVSDAKQWFAKLQKDGRGFNFFHFMVDLDQGPCAIKRLSGCGAGHEYLAVAPNGDIYPCHQFVGNKDFLMGNVNENKIDENIEKMFERSNVYTKEKCKNCFAKFYCSGGCAANSYNFHGNINDAYDVGCELQKKRIECAIMIRAAMAEEE